MGRRVTYTPKGAEPIPDVWVNWSRAHIEVDVQTTLPAHSDQPVARVLLEDLPQAPGRGDTLELSDGSLFEVLRAEEDGIAGADLFLHDVSP